MATTTKTTQKKKLEPIVDLDDVIDNEGSVEKLDLTNTTPGRVNIEDSSIILVKSNVFGQLNYTDKRTFEEVKWPKCGSIQPMTFGLLRSMKASSISFFKNQWIIIVGFGDENADKYTPADIYKNLMITQYYKDLIDPSDFEEVCSWTPEEIKKKVSLMSAEARVNLVVALNTYIEKGILDSIKRIKTFEEVLDCDLKIPE